MGARSTRKGKVGERELAAALTELLGTTHKRGMQFRGGEETADVAAQGSAIHWEAKRAETFSLYPSLEQSIRDSQPGQIPVVAHRKNKREWVVVVRLADLPALAAEIANYNPRPPLEN